MSTQMVVIFNLLEKFNHKYSFQNYEREITDRTFDKTGAINKH